MGTVHILPVVRKQKISELIAHIGEGTGNYWLKKGSDSTLYATLSGFDDSTLVTLHWLLIDQQDAEPEQTHLTTS